MLVTDVRFGSILFLVYVWFLTKIMKLYKFADTSWKFEGSMVSNKSGQMLVVYWKKTIEPHVTVMRWSTAVKDKIKGVKDNLVKEKGKDKGLYTNTFQKAWIELIGQKVWPAVAPVIILLPICCVFIDFVLCILFNNNLTFF